MMEKWPRTVYLANIVNLARLHSRVNWHSHCSCEVYSLGTRERVCVSTNLDRPVSSAVVYSRRACGDVFASPSVRQVYDAMKALPRKKTIVIITNCRVLCSPLCMVDYSSLHLHLAADTGDNLHFGLACQQARADGIENVDIPSVCDDVPVARSKGADGRRALASTILGMTFYGFVVSF